MTTRPAAPAALLLAFISLSFIPSGAAAQDKAWDACRGDKVDASIEGCSQVIKRGTRRAGAERIAAAYFNRGNGYFNKGQIDRAIADYSQSIKINPNYPYVWFNRGNAHANKGDHDKAIADYDAILKLDPGYLWAWFNRGNSHFANGDLDTAISDYDAALRIDPNYINAYINRGNAYRDKEAYARALADYDAALRIEPGNQLAIDNRAEAITRRAAAEATTEASREDATTREGTAAAAVDLDEKRVALVIGNGRYAAVPGLPNPARDAAAVAETLRAGGFASVNLVADADREAMVDALRRFAREAEDADWAVVYFAGHGIEFNGVNYLLPIDARLESERDAEFELVTLDRLVDAVQGAHKLRLVILDACRNNPFAARLTGATRAVNRGLARVEPDAGTLVAYAAKDGEVALDGEGAENSPFAAALVRRMAEPGLEIGKMFRLVHDDVMAATGSRQQPFVYGALPGEDFFFRPE